ncbi:MAG: plasmid stabilization protein [Candidatus Peregrinibacteria bacterium]|nr:plasmid stabilization protein [Candidatus Peregrinibacteria bacterium]
MTKINFTKKYKKIEKIFLRKHPDLLKRYIKTLEFLEINPFYPSLGLHKLKGMELYSVSINISYRITLEFFIEGDEVTLIRVGSHEEVY